MFENAEVIYSYTREQAIEDGVLVDARIGDLAEVTRQHFGSNPEARVVMTNGLFALMEQAVNNKRFCNDFKGVWHDVCHMGKAAARSAISHFAENGSVVYRPFRVIITGVGRVRLHTLVVTFDGEALTFGFREDF